MKQIGHKTYEDYVGNHESPAMESKQIAICKKCEAEMEEVEATKDSPIKMEVECADGSFATEDYVTGDFLRCNNCEHVAGYDEYWANYNEQKSKHMKQELKPCPFCGNKDVSIIKEYDENYSLEGIAICCSRPKGCGATSGYRQNIDDAIRAWNTRPDHSGETTEMIQGKTLTTDISESQMRYEIAKDMMPQIYKQEEETSRAYYNANPRGYRERNGADVIAHRAIIYADELINQLKQQSDEK